MAVRRSRFVVRIGVVCALAALAVLAGADSARADSGEHLWSAAYGEEGSQFVTDSAVDSAGNIVLVGSFTGRVDFGGGVLTDTGSGDIFVAKFDSAGGHLWSASYGTSTSSSGASAVAFDPAGHVFVAGAFDGSLDLGGGAMTSAGATDIFLAKFTPTGVHEWSKRFGSAAFEGPRGVVATSTGDVVVTGEVNDTPVDFGGGPLAGQFTDVFLARFTGLNGTHVWSKRFSTDNNQYVAAVDADAADHIVIAGIFGGTPDFGGGPLPNPRPHGDRPVYAARFDVDGNHIWSKAFGGAEGDRMVGGLDVDAAGNVALIGRYWPDINFGGASLTTDSDPSLFFAKLDSAGSHVWSVRPISQDSFVYPDDIVFTNDGGVAGTGYFTGSTWGPGLLNFGGGPMIAPTPYGDAFIGRLDAAGLNVWSKKFGTDGVEDTGTALAIGAAGEILLAGTFQVEVDLGGGALASGGARDSFAVAFDGALPADADGDGCMDAEELWNSVQFGGQRNPDSQWDFYDVNGTKKIDSVDIALVRSKFNQDYPPYDRSNGAAPWAPGPPDGTVNAVDIGLVRASFNHSCQGAPN